MYVCTHVYMYVCIMSSYIQSMHEVSNQIHRVESLRRQQLLTHSTNILILWDPNFQYIIHKETASGPYPKPAPSCLLFEFHLILSTHKSS
jgi:hypothetical protein